MLEEEAGDEDGNPNVVDDEIPLEPLLGLDFELDPPATSYSNYLVADVRDRWKTRRSWVVSSPPILTTRPTLPRPTSSS